MGFNRKMIRYFVLAVSLGICGQVKPQDVRVGARLDTTRALIGDQIRLHLRVEKPPQTHVIFPVIGDSLTTNIEVLKKSPVDTLKNGTGVVLRQDLLITVFDTGNVVIPSIPFGWVNGTHTDTLKTIPINLQIIPIQGDTTLSDIKANMRAPVNVSELMPYLLGLVVLGLLGFVIYTWLRKRKHKDSPSSRLEPAEAAHVIAIRMLEQLREEKSWTTRPVKTYYINLTDIVRQYISRRYGFTAFEQTTDEILTSLQSSACPTDQIALLKPVLVLADWVKFAKVVPGEAENITEVNQAIEFVKNTVPVVQPQAVAPETVQEQTKVES